MKDKNNLPISKASPNNEKGSLIKDVLIEADLKGLTDVKGYFDNNTLEIHAKDNTGAKVV